ncbi:ubiquitin-like-specific protease 1D [Canna indica]|uniref:Ubiquitin-like-specific protease 1D n=1 Tax=Canna indica TaxID=4628 RepID=A0AAQ3JQR3_9LILI|nr:ubiquitin-like-specific protease 1D [Canna indica]
MGDGSPPDAEVAGAAPGLGESAQAETSEFAHFTDHDLQAKIQRVLKNLSDLANRLPDRGAKLKASLNQMQAELQWRKSVVVPKDVGRCNRVTQSKDKKLPVSEAAKSYNATYGSPFQASFASKFIEKMEGQAGAARNEGLKELSQDKNKESGKNELQNHDRGQQNAISSQSSRFSSRKTPFRCVSSFYKKDQHSHRSLNGDCSLNESKSYPTTKRRATDSEDRNPMALKIQKVREVVLLDEEEVHSGDSPGDASDKWKEMKIYYPSRDDPKSIELSYEDIKCLDPESYLSSPIMNFYIQYLQVDKPRCDYHFFNTYFYKKLEEAVSYRADKACFQKLRRWWKGVNIFQKSYIFIPIHGDLHWSLVIICIPAKEDESGPIILHLDSLGIHNSISIFEVIDRYLKEEWCYINQNSPCPDIPISEKIWKHLSRRIEKKRIMVNCCIVN